MFVFENRQHQGNRGPEMSVCIYKDVMGPPPDFKSFFDSEIGCPAGSMPGILATKYTYSRWRQRQCRVFYKSTEKG